MQLQLLSSVSWEIWGSAREMERYWKEVRCALLKSRCVRIRFKSTLKLRCHIDHFKWEYFDMKQSNCLHASWSWGTVFSQKSLPYAVKTTEVISQNSRNSVNLSCGGLFSCRMKRSQVRLHQWWMMPLHLTAAFLQRIQVNLTKRK